MNTNDNLLVAYAEGRSRNFAKAKNKTESWGRFRLRFRKPQVTSETRKEFNKLSKEEQDDLKSIAGWFSGAQCSGGIRRLVNILPRNVATIDMDYLPADVPDQIKLGVFGISRFEFVAHSSRRHTPDEPRIRIIMPLSRKCDRDEYTAVIRIIGFMIDPDMELVDPVSYRAAQMMFLPTCSKDDARHYFYQHNDGELLDVDQLLADFERDHGDWRDLSLLPRHPNEENLRKRAEKAEDPTEKDGIVGDFCRAYNIFDVMEEFLPGVYTPGDEKSGHPRFTYTGSTSSNGAIVYDDGKFIYSHHGHDPGCDLNLNAFDFLRIHKFGELDKDAGPDKKITDLPSFKAMSDFADTLPPVRKQRVARNYDALAIFADAGIEPEQGDYDLYDDEDDAIAALIGVPDVEEDPELDADQQEIAEALAALVGGDIAVPSKAELTRTTPRSLPVQDADWLSAEIEMTKNGEIISNLPNVATIVYNDPRLRGVAAYNEFTQSLVCVRNLSTKIKAVPRITCEDPVNGSRWRDIFDTSIRALLEYPNGKDKAGYGMKVTDRDLVGGIMLAAERNRFHPIRDFLKAAKPGRWEDVETLLIRYFDLEDNEYHREVAGNVMLASVARIFNPGHKFDFAPILGGKQGIGKSTFIKALYGSEWFGEIACKLDEKQKIAEEIAGKWGCELPELSAFHKSDHNAAKMFLRRQFDDVRMAYDRRVTDFPRQAIFWGTTNDLKFLKDPTGNRSYWIVLVKIEGFFDYNGLVAERESLWGAAYAEYVRRTGGDFSKELDLSLRSEFAREKAEELQEAARTEDVFEIWRDRIELWLEEPVTYKQFMAELGKPLDDFPVDGEENNPTLPGETLVQRVAFRNIDAAKALGLPETMTNSQATQAIQKAIAEIDGWAICHERSRVQGIRDRWRYLENSTQAERNLGYRLYEGPL